MLDAPSSTIFFTDTGGGLPALLFVHGILMDHSVWRQQVKAFSGAYRVVCVDLRGFGQSAAESPEISYEEHAADLANLIASLGLRDVTLVGWSMGGAIAQTFAVTHAEAISRLVLVDTTPQLVADDRFALALPPEAAQQLGGLLAQDFVAGCAAFCSMISPEDEATTSRLTAIAARTSPDVAIAAFASSAQRSLIDLLPRINVPTTVISGSDDRICPATANAFLAVRIPGSTGGAKIVPDAGHAPFLTRPAEFNALLSAALTNIRHPKITHLSVVR